jgi:hypothetical protein
MEFRVSRGPFMESSLHSGILAITRPFHGIIPSLWDFSHHEALSWNHTPHLEILKTYELGGTPFINDRKSIYIVLHSGFQWKVSI